MMKMVNWHFSFWQKTLLILFGAATTSAGSVAPPNDDQVVVETGESSWVSIDWSGDLIYGRDDDGNRIPDFSAVGYFNGERPIPDVPVVRELSPQDTGDDTARIQKAIDEVESLPLGANGFRGKLLLRKGEYRVSGRLAIRASGVVLSGEGQDTVIVATGFGKSKYKRTLIYIGESGKPTWTPVETSRREIVDHYVPIGTQTFSVSSTAGYHVGDMILVYRPGTQAWIESIGCDKIPPRMTDVSDTYWKKEGDDKGFYYARSGISHHQGIHPEPGERWEDFEVRIKKRLSADKKQMNVTQQWKPGDYDFYFQRKITGIRGNTIEIDAPIVEPIRQELGGGAVYHYKQLSMIYNVGVENMLLLSEFAPPVEGHPMGDPKEMERSENHAWVAVRLGGDTYHTWVRNVYSKYFGFATVQINGINATVIDCASLGQASKVTGGRRYPFVINGQRNLVQRCKTVGGRHEFVLQARTLGPNVFVDCLGVDSRAKAGPHHRYTTGTLFDNVSSDEAMESTWRGNSGTGHAWAGTQSVFYNCTAPRFHLKAPPGGLTWSIGSGPEDTRSEDSVQPQSLYYTQLRERLGDDAVSWQASEAQLHGLGDYGWADGIE